MLTILMLSILTSLQFFFIIPLVIGHFFKIQAYQIVDQTERNQILTKLNIFNSTFIMNDKPHGLIYGKWFIGYISKNSNEKEQSNILYLVINKNTFNCLKQDIASETDNDGNIIEQQFITICERSGTPWWWEYKERKYNTTKYLCKTPRKYQQSVIDEILEIVAKKSSKSGTFFVYGKPGSGKSLMLMLLAKQINAYYCDTWNPTEPGDFLSKAYSSINPTEVNPLVIVLEECDAIINDMLCNRIEHHKHIPTEVRKKSEWNRLLDKTTDLGFYPNLILVLTSNCSITDIHQKDSSLLRDGRIDKSFHVKKY